VRELQIPETSELMEWYRRRWEEHAQRNLKSSEYIKQQEKKCGKRLNNISSLDFKGAFDAA